MQPEVELLHSFPAFTVYVLLKQLTMFCVAFLDFIYPSKDGLFEKNHCFLQINNFKLNKSFVFCGHLVVKKMSYI